MELIYPLTAEGVRPHLGRSVCAVLRDGTHHYGRMVNMTESGIYLEKGAHGTGTVSSTNADKAAAQLKQQAGTLQTKAFFPFFYPFFFPFASLAFLYAWPFFLI